MSIEDGPWEKRWHTFVEGRESLGGADADFIDIEKDILNAPRLDDVILQDVQHILECSPAVNTDESSALTNRRAVNGVLIGMHELGIPGALTVLSKLEETPLKPHDIFMFDSVLDTISFYADESGAAPSLEGKKEFKKLSELTSLAMHMASARTILLFNGQCEDLDSVLEATETVLAESALSEDSRNIIQGMIDDLRDS